MIIGAVTALMMLLGGGGTFSFEKVFGPFVKDAVPDQARYEQIVDSFKKTDDDLEAYQKEVDDVWAEKYKTLMSDYDATEDDFRAVRDDSEKSRKVILGEFLDVRFGMTKLMTNDEWDSMFEAMAAAAKDDA